MLAREYPGVTFYTVPVDIVTQILNFGLAAPIDIQIVGPNLYANRALAERMLNEVRYVPGAADVRIQQPFNYPNLTVNVDRTRAASTGLTQQNVAQSLLVALSGSFQTSPSFYLDPRNGVSYNIAVQAPQYRMNIDGATRKPAHHRQCGTADDRGLGAFHGGAGIAMQRPLRGSAHGRAGSSRAGADPRQSGHRLCPAQSRARSATTTCSR